LALAATFAYGHSRGLELALQAKRSDAFRKPPRVAIIQTNMLADWKGTPERDARAMTDQFEQSLAAVRDSDKPVDLIVWPETMFRQPLFMKDLDNPAPEGAIRASNFTAAERDLRSLVDETGAAALVGIDRVLISAPDELGATRNYRLQVYNSSAFMDRNGRLVGTYDKMHLLPFGEFIPLQGWFPFLEKYSPISGDSLWGARAAAFELDETYYAPNICYETVLPHLIRRQFHEAVDSVHPDVLVNLTNDAWYWGSSELDMHLASGVFRAIEMRRPLVIAANRGLSAYIDDRGRVVAVTERDEPDAMIVDVRLPDPASVSFYAQWGDWLSLACLACCVTLAAVGVHWRRALRSADSASRLNS
jgi:apolipoprotein N-acyltransferase